MTAMALKAKRDPHLNPEIIMRTRLQRTGDAADAKAVAEAAVSTWRDATSRLSPVIGGQGVDVLFRRSIHVASKTFPWLVVPGQVGSTSLLANLNTCLAGRETAVAIEASDALLVTFTELLTSLIGESLSERLLAPIWAPPLPASDRRELNE